MNRSLSSLARRRSARIAIGAAAAALAALALALSGAAGSHRVPPPPAHPTSADQIQNLDQVEDGDLWLLRRTRPIRAASARSTARGAA